MDNTHALPDSLFFTVSTTGTREYELRLGIMSNESVETLLTRAVRILCANATGAKDWTPAEKESEILKCIARYESGKYGAGIKTRLPAIEKELRKAFETWLVKRGAKESHASEVARTKGGVYATFMAIVADKGLNEEKAESLYARWIKNAEEHLAKLAAMDDDLSDDESDEEESAAE